LSGKLSNRVGDCIVEAAVERSKLVYGERGVALDGDVGYGLAEIAVKMNNQVKPVYPAQQLFPMCPGADS
jgi:hypothetical protein